MKRHDSHFTRWAGTAVLLCLLLLTPCVSQAQEAEFYDETAVKLPEQATLPKATTATVIQEDSLSVKVKADRRHRSPVLNATGDTVKFTAADSLRLVSTDSLPAANLGRLRVFNPDPMRAMWLSALCPGLGQIYNRRYWKLPIIVGAFVGLGYGTAWNNRMLGDYTKAYRDFWDNDPATKSYMDFFPPTVKESDIDMSWLGKTLKNKKNYYRRYKEICIISMIGVYLLNVVDAYVDASLSHFDISSDLSLDMSPAIINQYNSRAPSWGMQCAINF